MNSNGEVPAVAVPAIEIRWNPDNHGVAVHLNHDVCKNPQFALMLLRTATDEVQALLENQRRLNQLRQLQDQAQATEIRRRIIGGQ